MLDNLEQVVVRIRKYKISTKYVIGFGSWYKIKHKFSL